MVDGWERWTVGTKLRVKVLLIDLLLFVPAVPALKSTACRTLPIVVTCLFGWFVDLFPLSLFSLLSTRLFCHASLAHVSVFLCFFVYCYILTTLYYFFFHLCLTDASLCWRVSLLTCLFCWRVSLVRWVYLFMCGLWHTDNSFSFSKASFCQRVLLSTRLKFSQVCVSFFKTCFYWRVFLLTRVLCHASFFRWVFFMLLTCLLGWRVFLSGDLFSLVNLFFCWRVFFVDASVC